MPAPPVRHLLDVESLPDERLAHLLDLAERPADPTCLAGRTVMLLFFEPSTRTRHSFELAAQSLGGRTLALEAGTSSLAKGESLIDTGQTAEALGAAAIVMRHGSSGAPHVLARHVGVPVINAGDGTHEHPTQALADLLTVRRRRGRLAGLRVVIVGDVLHSRVARSAVLAFSRMGSEVVCCGPATLLPPGLPVAATTDLDRALEGADVVMALRIQGERQAAGGVPRLDEYRRRWRLTADRLARARPDVLVLHPGPVMRGTDLDETVLADDRSGVLSQVAAGVAVRRAVLREALA